LAGPLAPRHAQPHTAHHKNRELGQQMHKKLDDDSLHAWAHLYAWGSTPGKNDEHRHTLAHAHFCCLVQFREASCGATDGHESLGRTGRGAREGCMASYDRHFSIKHPANTRSPILGPVSPNHSWDV